MRIHQLIGEYVPYPPPKDYENQLQKWLKNNPNVVVGTEVYFPLTTKVLGTHVEIKTGTIINGPMVIKGSASVTIGKYCAIAENLRIISSNHDMGHLDVAGRFSTNLDTAKGPVYIGNNVWIGDNVTILSGVHIGNGAVVGAGSIVTHDVPAFAVVAGIPAKLLKYRFEEKIIDSLEAIGWWHWDQSVIAENKHYFQERLSAAVINDLLDIRGCKQDVAKLQMKAIETSDYLLEGWGPREETFRWIMSRISRFVLLVNDPRSYRRLSLLGYSYFKEQLLQIRINGQLLEPLLMTNILFENSILVNRYLRPGVNMFALELEHCYRPANIDKTSADQRELFAYISQISLEK